MKKGSAIPGIPEIAGKLDRVYGQSTIEFILTIILLISFCFFYYQMSMIFAFGNYVHYATFMSARAYLAAGGSEPDQRERARNTIVAMLKKSVGMSGVDKFPMIAKGVGGGDPGGFEVLNNPPPLIWMKGVRYTFKGKLFLIPLGGAGQSRNQSSPNSLTLSSESWLGKEPSFQECGDFMGPRGWEFDNGC